MAKRIDFGCLSAVDNGLTGVIAEFAEVFGKHIPPEYRNKVAKAAVFSWLSEQLTSAVQSKVNFAEARAIEEANNCVRFGYGGLIHSLGESNHISVDSIIGKSEHNGGLLN